jgi:hypothetical protein
MFTTCSTNKKISDFESENLEDNIYFKETDCVN